MAKMGRPIKKKVNRRIIRLRDVCHLKFAEIGRILGLTRNGTRLAYLRQKQRDAIKTTSNTTNR